MADSSPAPGRLGRFVDTPVAGEVVRAFIPPPLPPNPAIDVPVLTANQLVARTGLTAPTVNAALVVLVRMGIVHEMTGRRRSRMFGYGGYLEILSEGTEPLAK